jgi:hypothetical protein
LGTAFRAARGCGSQFCCLLMALAVILLPLRSAFSAPSIGNSLSPLKTTFIPLAASFESASPLTIELTGAAAWNDTIGPGDAVPSSGHFVLLSGGRCDFAPRDRGFVREPAVESQSHFRIPIVASGRSPPR